MPLDSPTRIRSDFAALEALVDAPVASEPELLARLQQVHAALYQVDLANYDVGVTRSEAPDLLRAIF